MNVAFVNSTHRWGGVKSWTLRVAGGLVSRGHRVDFYLRPGDPFVEACRGAGHQVTELSFGPDWNPVAQWRLRRALRGRPAAVAVVNVSKDIRIAGPVCRALGIPVLQRVGRTGDIRPRRRVRWEQARYVDRIVVPAESIRDDLARIPWMRAGDRVRVVPNGVDLDRFRPGAGAGALRAELALAADVPLVITTSQIVAVKGHAVLLRAVSRLAGFDPAPVLVLVGTGSEVEPLRALAARLGLGDRVRFPGFRRDLERVLDDATVAVLPTLDRGEGFPNCVVEFMAKGKPLIATRQAGVPEAVTDGTEGLLVPPGDEEALTAALARLLGDPGLRARLGRSARERAERDFGIELMVDRVESLLREMVSGERTGGE